MKAAPPVFLLTTDYCYNPRALPFHIERGTYDPDWKQAPEPPRDLRPRRLRRAAAGVGAAADRRELPHADRAPGRARRLRAPAPAHARRGAARGAAAGAARRRVQGHAHRLARAARARARAPRGARLR